MKLSEVCYEGLSSDIDVEEVTDIIEVPDYCSLSNKQDCVELNIPTMFMCDESEVCFKFVIAKENGLLTLQVNDKDILVGDYGFKTHMSLRQRDIDALIYMYNCMSPCKGRNIDVDFKSKSICKKTWKSMFEECGYEEIKIHSTHCAALRKINSLNGKTCCEHCTHDINAAIKYQERKSLDTCDSNPQSAVEDCTEEDKDKEHHLDPTVVLTEEDNDDFCCIIEQIRDKAPKFDVLLKSQLLNARHKDPRQWRWDTSVISFCIHSWAQSPNSYRAWQSSKSLIVKKGDSWHSIGAIDLGPLVNSMEFFWLKKHHIKLATHCLQYLYVGFSGFRWPVAYYATNNATAHQIYYTFWELVKELYEYGFDVTYTMLDGSVMNRNFTKLMFPGDPRDYNF